VNSVSSSRSPHRLLAGLLTSFLFATTLAACGSNADAVTKLKFERVNTATANPFMPNVGTDVVVITPPADTSGKIYGDSPGLYGGTQNVAACDPAKMISFLEANPDKGAAWARTLGIKQSDIRTYIGTLTPVILRTNTAVTNHGFASGSATTIPAVLQAGTAVLVNSQGVPVVKCYCGNPLTPPPTNFRAPGPPPTIIIPGCVDGPERAVPCDVPGDTSTTTIGCVDGPERAVPCDVPGDTPGDTTTTFVLCDPDAYASPSTVPNCFQRPSGTVGSGDQSLPAGYRPPKWRAVPSGGTSTTATDTRYYDGTSSAGGCSGSFEQASGATPITVRRQGDRVYIGTEDRRGGEVQADGRVSYQDTYHIEGDPPGTRNGEVQVEGQFAQGRFTGNIRSSAADEDGYCDSTISALESTIYDGTITGTGVCEGISTPIVVRQTNATISFEADGVVAVSGPIGSNQDGFARFSFAGPATSIGGVTSNSEYGGRVQYPSPSAADQSRRVDAIATITITGGPIDSNCKYVINAVERARTV